MVQESVSGPVSEQAALAQTAYEVLVSLFPVRKPIYDAALATSLDGNPERRRARRGPGAWARRSPTPSWRCARTMVRRISYSIDGGPQRRAVVADSADVPTGDRSAMGQRHAVRDRQCRRTGVAARTARRHHLAGVGRRTSTRSRASVRRPARRAPRTRRRSHSSGAAAAARRHRPGLWNTIAQIVAQAKGPEPVGERAHVRAVERRHGGCGDRRLGRQIHQRDAGGRSRRSRSPTR